MKKPELKKYILDFYEKHKDNELLLSKKEIIKLKKKNIFQFYFLDIFGHQSEYSDPNNQDMLRYYMKDLVFGFKSGIVVGTSRVVDLVIEEYYEIKDKNYYINLKNNSSSIIRVSLKKEMSLHNELDKVFKNYYKELNGYIKFLENQKIKLFKSTKQVLLKKLDKDGNGIIDIIEVNDDLKSLLNKHQELIIETDKKYLHNLVKISNYLKDKRNNIQLIFEHIRDSGDLSDLEEYVGILSDEIHTYELLLLHSLSMIVSIKEKNFITFYEIYEQFDKLRIFESNWEKELSNDLKHIGERMGEIIYSIHEMNYEIVSKLDELNFITQNSFDYLSESIERELKSINSSIDTNTLVSSINTYQTYKLRTNLKK